LKGDELDPEGKQKTEVLELWHRDPVDCVRELLGNPTFKNQGYAPIRVFKSFDAATGAYSNREYSEMWTADWWWKIQVRFFVLYQFPKTYVRLGIVTQGLDARPNNHRL
jgi:hypothetical protein